MPNKIILNTYYIRLPSLNDRNIRRYIKLYLDGNQPQYPPIETWDVSNITNMSNLFNNKAEFNEPLNNWDVRNVVNMSRMFNKATSFNQPLNNWKVSANANTTNMFRDATAF